MRPGPYGGRVTAAPLTLPARALTGAFLASGVIHLARPQVFEPLVPSWVPVGARRTVHLSGVAELACAAAVLHPATRQAGGWATAALLLAILPGNVQMARDGQRARSRAWRLGTLARVPLQAPLVGIALRVARGR
ncbi:membrane protein [Nocardioides aquaticus]